MLFNQNDNKWGYVFVVISMHIPTAVPSTVVNATEYGKSDSPTAVILKVASEPSDTVCEDGSTFSTISIKKRNEHNIASQSI